MRKSETLTAVEWQDPKTACFPDGNGPSGTVLVLDNEGAVCAMIARILRTEGLEVHTADNARDAVDIVSQNPAISVAILDWRMPDMSGEIVCDQLAEISPDIRTIVISGDDPSEVKQAFSGRNVEHFLAKPFRIEALVAAISRVARNGAGPKREEKRTDD